MRRATYKNPEASGDAPTIEVVSPGYLAQKTGLSRYYIRKMCDGGKIEATRGPGGHWQINLDSAMAAIANLDALRPRKEPDNEIPKVCIRKAKKAPLPGGIVLLTPEELSVALRETVAPRTLVRWAFLGLIPAVKCGRKFLFRIEEVVSALSTHRPKAIKKAARPSSEDLKRTIMDDMPGFLSAI